MEILRKNKLELIRLRSIISQDISSATHLALSWDTRRGQFLIRYLFSFFIVSQRFNPRQGLVITFSIV